MKKSLTIFISFLVLFSCNVEKSNKIVLSGKVENLNGELHLEGGGLNLKCTPSENGLFKFSSNLSLPNYIILKSDNSEVLMFLFPGDSININFDDRNWISTVQYSGDLINEQIYLRDYSKLYNSVADTFDATKYYSLEPDEFLKAVNSYKQLFLDRLNKHDKLDNEFKGFENQRILYIWSWDKNTYPKNHFIYTRKLAQLPADYFDYLKDINLNDTTLMQLTDYTDFLKTYVDVQYFIKVQDQEDKGTDRFLKTKIKLEVIDKTFHATKIRNYLFSDIFSSQIDELAIDSIDLIKFDSLCTNKELKEFVSAKYKVISSLVKGQPAAKFKLLAQDKKTISLDDFKGKYLYIDFWSLYCAPCLREMPYFNELVKDFQGKNISFLSICVAGAIHSNELEQWKKIMLEKKLLGTQIWLDKDQSELIMKDFKITAEPTYILIDKEGRLIDPRALNPSENVKDVLLNLKDI